MNIKVEIKKQISDGAVQQKLFKEDFIVTPSEWKVHSFAYKAPRGDKTRVELDIHVKNVEGLMKVVKTSFDYAISNVQKVLNILGDKEAFEIDTTILSESPVDAITVDSVKCKYPYVKVVNMEYKKPIEISRTAVLRFELDIDGIVYPYSQSIKFAKTEYKTVFDNLRPSMFEVSVDISPEGAFIVSDVINKTGSDKIKVYDAQILGLNATRTLDVMLYISGNSKNKNVVVKSNPIAASKSFEQLIDKIIKFRSNIEDSPRFLNPDELILNKPEWLHVEKISWINSDDVTTNIGRYIVELHIADEVFQKDVQVTFDYGNDYVFMNKLTEQNIIIDDAYLFAPTETIPPEAALLVQVETLPEHGLNDLTIESIKFVGNKINRTNKIIEYNITFIIGSIRKVLRKNLAFKFSLNESDLQQFNEASIFVTKLPTTINSNENIFSISRKFIDKPSLAKVDVFSKLKSKDLKEIELAESNLTIKIVEMNILRFDSSSRGAVKIEIGFKIKGDDDILYKVQNLPGRIAEEVTLESIDASEIILRDKTLLDGVRPKYLVKDQFILPIGTELINIEILNVDDEEPYKLSAKFTVQINQNIKVIEKDFMFKTAEEVVVEETAEEAVDNDTYLETIDLSSMSVFVEVDKEPPYMISSSMFAGLPDDVKIIVDYKWPKVGVSDIELDVAIAKGNARKHLTIPIIFEKPLSKETLKEYKKKKKIEKKGGVNG